jgi:hypothetical protein
VNLPRRIAADLRRGENIDVYVTIVVALVIAVLNLIGLVPSSNLTSLVLAVLGLLAIGGLATRSRLDQLRDAIVQSGPMRTEFPDSFAADLAKSGELWLVGVSRRSFINTYFHQLADRLRAGHEVRVLLVRPGSAGAQLAEGRWPTKLPGVMDRSIEASLAVLAGLHASAGGRLHVRLTEQELSFGAVYTNPNTSSARLYLEYYAYKTRVDTQLRMMLSRRDGAWLDHFREQLDELWADATPALEQPPAEPTPAGDHA